MPTNEAVTSSLVFSGQVPPDMECRINSASQIAEAMVAILSIQTTNPDGTPSPPDDSVAQLALSTANSALALAQSVQASQKQVRSSTPVPIPQGDNSITFPFGTPMPSTNYVVMLTLYAGTTNHPAAYYGVRVLQSSLTTTSFSVLTDNIPANTLLAFYAVEV